MTGLEYDERPWGNYTVLSDEDDHKVKRIVVHPGKRLSYQTHARRAEHWYVVSGTATVTLASVVLSWYRLQVMCGSTTAVATRKAAAEAAGHPRASP